MSDFLSKEHIYNLVCGHLEERYAPESAVIPSEFEEGEYCAQAYNRMLEAYSRLCERLGVEEWNDRDVESIINELMAIGKHVALKMYDYGARYGGEAKEHFPG